MFAENIFAILRPVLCLVTLIRLHCWRNRKTKGLRGLTTSGKINKIKRHMTTPKSALQTLNSPTYSETWKKSFIKVLLFLHLLWVSSSESIIDFGLIMNLSRFDDVDIDFPFQLLKNNHLWSVYADDIGGIRTLASESDNLMELANRKATRIGYIKLFPGIWAICLNFWVTDSQECNIINR